MATGLKNRSAIFWDVSPADIERVLAESGDWVIVRVFEYGTLDDIRDVIDLYGKARAKKVLSSTPLPPVARAMAYLFLDVDPDNKYAA